MASNPVLNLPPYDMKLIREEDAIKVFDVLRQKYVALTPEEYVRQHFVNYLCNHLGYPSSLVANEVSINVNEMSKRCDTVVFRNPDHPLMIVEYKAPGVAISQATFDQIVRYNMALKARYLVVSNGLNHYCCVVDYENDTYHFIPEIPDYPSVITGNRDN
ncbi:MAG: type I restriction enzyme HsdR N-terminal domain-containing protein [Bacteroidales bacterium]|nr:type I restriction enzyme HsdR N-terminal domain-containing protein [Bacteroidales bacterium]MBD5222291.1 type I restriction enzyme HsdR N-terminal domain-containing protein [Bacteroidales bacterium]